MSEKSQRRRVIQLLRPLHAVPVENPAQPGTPDVNYTGGWIELKCLTRWPSRGGVVRIAHFTRQQRVWLRRRCTSGGRAHLLLQVGREWMLFDGVVAANKIGLVDREELYSLARWRSSGPVDAQELMTCLSS